MALPFPVCGFLRSLSLWGQPVLLESAVWLAGDGHFYEAVGQCGCQIEQAEVLACAETERCLQAVAVHLAAQGLERPSDLGCHLECDLGCRKRFDNDPQHELDGEGTCTTPCLPITPAARVR